MTTSLFAVQEAVYGALMSSAVLQALIGSPARVYDVVPPSSLFPYVTLGDVVIKQFDTKDQTGFEQMLTLHVWSRYRGRKELKQITQTIYDVLHHAALTVTGANYVSCQFLAASTAQENDGLTLHGILRYRIVVQH
ncbi:MAG: DUF3168 domain-containing protein [Alphaproteobacteria bacterium]|nr:DUF3168 domain-containing protein [Alphaproteobacteria bacterium]